MQWLIDLIKAIFAAIFGGKATTVPKPEKSADEPVSGEPKWMKLARAELGQAEIPGAANNPRIISYYAKAGFAGIRDETVPWCAGFANAMLESAGVPGSKSLTAREFLTWGSEVKKPYPGCIVVLWRNSPESWEGHTGFYVGETSTHISILAGNQGNKVSIDQHPKYQLLGYREPFKPSKSRIMKASTGQMALLGLDGAVILESQSELSAIGQLIGQMGATIPQFLIASFILKILLVCLVIYARTDDASKKGT
jgi:uncharacterized protein (TIGR02594 family)